MRAVEFLEHGGIHVLHIREVPTPSVDARVLTRREPGRLG
jgi:hypothetical protein